MAATQVVEHYIGEEDVLGLGDGVLHLSDHRSADVKAFLGDALSILQGPYRSYARGEYSDHSETTSVYGVRVKSMAELLDERDYGQGLVEHTLRSENYKRGLKVDLKAQFQSGAFKGSIFCYAALPLRDRL